MGCEIPYMYVAVILSLVLASMTPEVSLLTLVSEVMRVSCRSTLVLFLAREAEDPINRGKCLFGPVAALA